MPSELIDGDKFLINKLLSGFFVSLLFYSIFVCCSYGNIIDRLVAYVDNTAITLSDLRDETDKMRKKFPHMTERDVLNSMINRILLIKEAGKIRFEAHSDDELINAYLDFKIRSRIFIKEEDISDFYKKHPEEFKGQDELQIRAEIEKYLLEKEFNSILKEHLKELWQLSDIKILFTDK